MDNVQDVPMTPTLELQIEKVPETKEQRPTDAEALREFEIRIKFLNRGCIVSVGCKDIAFEDYTNAMAAINNYVDNPWDEQQKWRKLLG